MLASLMKLWAPNKGTLGCCG